MPPTAENLRQNKAGQSNNKKESSRIITKRTNTGPGEDERRRDELAHFLGENGEPAPRPDPHLPLEPRLEHDSQITIDLCVVLRSVI